MSCSINRYKFVGSGSSSSGTKENTEGAKELEARMKEMLEVRAAQDKGEFKKVVPPTQVVPQSTVPSGGTILFKTD